MAFRVIRVIKAIRVSFDLSGHRLMSNHTVRFELTTLGSPIGFEIQSNLVTFCLVPTWYIRTYIHIHNPNKQ